MQTMREYLAGLNPPLAKMGRGRFSAAAKAEIEKQLAAGMQFSDSPGNSAPVKTKKDSAPKKEKKPASVSGSFGDTPDKIWHNAQWYVEENGKKIPLSGIEVCRTCGYSLDYQACRIPTYPSVITGEMLEVRR